MMDSYIKGSVNEISVHHPYLHLYTSATDFNLLKTECSIRIGLGLLLCSHINVTSSEKCITYPKKSSSKKCLRIKSNLGEIIQYGLMSSYELEVLR